MKSYTCDLSLSLSQNKKYSSSSIEKKHGVKQYDTVYLIEIYNHPKKLGS